jgi:hypothetical protein
MTPQDFTFKLTVPAGPDGATVVAVAARHAVDYAGLNADAGKAFVDKVRAAAAQALTGATGHHCVVVFAARDGQLTVTVGGQSVSQPLTA